MIPKRPAAGTVQSIEFNGTWEEVLAEKELFQNVVRYSVPHRLKLGTPHMEWKDMSELFGEAPLTIRISDEVIIGDKVKPNIHGIQEYLRSFSLINCLKFTHMQYWATYNLVTKECNDRFLQWCIENSISQLVVDKHGALLSDDAVLDFCFGPHGFDSDPKHLKARFRCGADFLERLLEANRKCIRKGAITLDVLARNVNAPTSYSERRQWVPSRFHVEVYRPARQDQ